MGLFATEVIHQDQLLGELPLKSCCVTAADALDDPDIGGISSECLESMRATDSSGEALLIAAFIAHAASDHDCAARRKIGPYVESLPWGPIARFTGSSNDEEEDPLAEHPLVLPRTAFEQQRFERAERTAAAVFTLLQSAGSKASLAMCKRAVILLISRSFDFSKPMAGLSTAAAQSPHPAIQWRQVLVPVFDCLNHPSISALDASGEGGVRFRAQHVYDSVVNWSIEEREWDETRESQVVVRIRSPHKMAIDAGTEVWNWYGDAGWGAKTAKECEAAEASFVSTYGFSPWQ
jgi:hypothetical protein